MIIGLLEVHHHDKDGNLLGIAKGHNILFDNMRVSMLLNPSIVDNIASFNMYFSEFQDTLLSFYTYWDSSPITAYASSTVTINGGELTSAENTHSLMFTITSTATLPGATARTLRVVGIRLAGSTLCSAITLNTPIAHGTTTYVTGYYKLVLGATEESILYGNLYNWRSRGWVLQNFYEYKKDFLATSAVGYVSSFNNGGNETITSLTARTPQSAYTSLGLNTSLSSPAFFGAKMKDGNTSVALFNNSGIATRSRTFLHPYSSINKFLWCKLNAEEPLSEGSVRIGDNDNTPDYSSITCVDIIDSGSVGTATYNVTIYPVVPASTRYSTNFSGLFYNFIGGTSGRYFYAYNMYVSKNRKWASFHRNYYDTNYNGSITRDSSVFIFYKSLYYTLNTGGLNSYQYNGIIADDGGFFYTKSASPSILRKYEIEKRYEKSYVEETVTLPSNVIRGYQVDEDIEDEHKVVVIGSDIGSELVTNGDFSSGTSGWSVESNVSLTVSGGVGRLTINNLSGRSKGFYQYITTEVGKLYQIKITYLSVSYWGYAGGWSMDVGSSSSYVIPSYTDIKMKTYTDYYLATSTSTLIKVKSSSSAQANEWHEFDNISVREISNNKIYKVDPDDISSYETYDISHPNFSALSLSSMFVASSETWYWKIGQGKMVWISQLKTNKMVHYWDGENIVETYTETTVGTIGDISISSDFKKIAYYVQSGTTCTWFIRSLEDGSRWVSLYSWSTTITGTAGCFIEENWMYILSGAQSWGYRVNLISMVSESFPCFGGRPFGNGSVSYERFFYLPNRSVVPGSVMYNFISWGTDYSYSPVTAAISWLIVHISPLNYGWDGTQWIHNHSGSRTTHRDVKDLPQYCTIGFGDDYWEDPSHTTELVSDDPEDVANHTGWDYHSGVIENYVAGEYYNFAVNPGGYVFDNSMTYSTTAWVYSGIPQYAEETFFLMWTNPTVPENITITLAKATHPDWLAYETSNLYLTIEFDTGLKGIQLTSTSYLSYFGEYCCISSTAGTLTFYQSCNLHSVTVKYYWIRRD